MITLKSRRRQPSKQRERKLLVQTLERRTVLAADVYVNDNFNVVTDIGTPGLSEGDTVDISSVAGAATDTAIFGADAFADIDAAVDAVDANGTVHVLEGTYDADVTIDKSITLAGANAGVSAGVDGGERGAESIIDGGIQVTAANVTIDGFTINGGIVTGGETAGIFLASGASGATISNNILVGEDAGRGILSAFNGENDDLLIENNEISDWATAIYNQSNTNVEITGNLIHDNVVGISNDFVDGAVIEGNDFKNNDEAIGTLDSVDLVVEGNDLADNLVAIANYGGDSVEAIGNFWGTADPDEILELIDGDVLTDSPLSQSPFEDVTELPDLVFTSTSGATLTVDQVTGDFEFTSGNLVVSGTGAVIKNGKLMIHTHDAFGRKIDVKGDLGGTLDVAIKQLGKGIKKQTFSMTMEDAEANA